MTFHSGRNDVIESDDISDVVGVHVTEENGVKVATIKAILDPRKDFLAVKDFFVHLTNGINHRLLGPFTTPESPADLPAAPASTPVEAETGTETTQPIPVPQSEASTSTEATASTGTQGAPSTAEVSTDNSTTVDTVELPSVADSGKKGK